MKEELTSLKAHFDEEVKGVSSVAEVEDLQVKFLGRKGPLQQLMKSLKSATSEERPLLGKLLNDLKVSMTATLDEKKDALHHQEVSSRLEEEKIDVTLPGRRKWHGKKHIVLSVLDEVIDILVEMGFTVQYGPDIDTDYYNFESLNFMPHHPARDMQDTFYLSDSVLLRTHTTNIQVRVMENHKPPIRIISPGKAYRNESISARSHVFFHQVDAFYVDKGVTFSNLLATIKQFHQRMFGEDVPFRIRPSYFPFVEPGLEMDVHCLVCNGKGCPVCKHTGWLEVLGAGMVHPEVLKNGGIDPEEYSGFAWGMGIERLVMVKYGIDDIRLFTENDLRLLRQFH